MPYAMAGWLLFLFHLAALIALLPCCGFFTTNARANTTS
jgi:hypothetical protein